MVFEYVNILIAVNNYVTTKNISIKTTPKPKTIFDTLPYL